MILVKSLYIIQEGSIFENILQYTKEKFAERSQCLLLKSKLSEVHLNTYSKFKNDYIVMAE